MNFKLDQQNVHKEPLLCFHLESTLELNSKNFFKCINTNENREVVLYDHFAGDNSSLKFII